MSCFSFVSLRVTNVIVVLYLQNKWNQRFLLTDEILRSTDFFRIEKPMSLITRVKFSNTEIHISRRNGMTCFYNLY